MNSWGTKIVDWLGRLPNFLVTIVSALLAFGVGAIMIAISGISPWVAYKELIISAVGSEYALTETLVKMIPLLLAGLGMALAFRGKLFNIGAEGQIYMGALGAGAIGLFCGPISPWLGIALIMLAGFICGGIWAGIAGVLKERFGFNEIIVTLMMNYIAIGITSYLVGGPWRDPMATEPFTAKFAEGARLPVIWSGSTLHAGLIIGLVATLVLWWVIRQTVYGYQLTVTGLNAEAARYGGVKTGSLIVLTMFISGGLAGLAGVSEIAGIQHRILEGFSPGYGYTAIAIAFLGRLHPIGVLLAAFFFAALVVGAEGMQIVTGVPVTIVLLIEGLVLLFVIGSDFLRKRGMRRQE
jgi:general nucleoside transport system permease protein